ncbi:hypothetical protein LSCM4_06612 [Leishmania orientalis]|uniref:Uncharacterized protein n=1 Tax=Leishmania orientalis TaxID=2249476 RepID=A0A836H4F4_9TRYP|nr:hypothetical protein LSCM4_06612 [Leishmania orientalis]
MPSPRSSSESSPRQRGGTSNSAVSSPYSSDRKRARWDDGTSAPTAQSRGSSEDAQRACATPAPPLAASVRHSDEPKRRPPCRTDMEDSNIMHTFSQENSIDGPPHLSSLAPSPHPTPPHVALGTPTIRSAAAGEHVANAPASPLPRKIAHASSNGRREFVVMLNHKRVVVSAEYPFLRPRDLFAPRTTKAVTEAGRCATGACDPDGCVVAADEATSRPLHCYGDRPVLLLDCTGELRQRRQRRQRRQELLSRASKLVAARADLLRTQSLWSTRWTRARRHNKELSVPMAAVDDAGVAPDRGGDDSTDSSSCGAAAGGVSVQHLLSQLSQQRKAITHEIKAVRHELLGLLQEKREQAATREGCVLMLPSPETGEVRLLPGHHYRTACFVSDELREVLPSDARGMDVAPWHRRHHRTPPQRESASELMARELSHSDEGGAEGEQTMSKAIKRPLWAKAELLGYVLYLRQCRRNPHCRSHRGATLGNDSTDYQELREGGADLEKIAATISYDMVENYLALPACEVAMYREWAIDKFHLLPPQ